MGMRVSEHDEEKGLDEALHKESIFDSSHGARTAVAVTPNGHTEVAQSDPETGVQMNTVIPV